MTGGHPGPPSPRMIHQHSGADKPPPPTLSSIPSRSYISFTPIPGQSFQDHMDYPRECGLKKGESCLLQAPRGSIFVYLNCRQT